jgi:hypothetical protein
MSTDPLVRDLVAMLHLTRDAERDVFGPIPDDVRSRPVRPGDWSPKDHQAHLTAWKSRQADRYAAARRGEAPVEGSDEETDAVNAQLQRATAGWSWTDVERQADEVSARLISEIEAAGPAVLADRPGLVGSTFGNGAYHAVQHFGWLRSAGIAVDPGRTRRLVADLEELVERGSLPDADRGIALYNTACYAALEGEPARALALLPRAFALNPDLAELAQRDDDLASVRSELDLPRPQ